MDIQSISDRLLHRIVVGFVLAVVICGTSVLPRIGHVDPLLIVLGMFVGIAILVSAISYVKRRISGNEFHETASSLALHRNIFLIITVVAIISMGIFSSQLQPYYKLFDYVGVPITVGFLVSVGGLLAWLLWFESKHGRIFCVRRD